MTRQVATGWLGVATSLGFLLLLVGFAALRPDYSHYTNAVSELGVVGAPNQIAWNLLGFVGIGLALTVFGWRLGEAVHSRVAGVLLVLFGLSFAATAIPADMNDLSSPGSTAHVVASQAVLLFWALGVGRLAFLKSAGGGLRIVSGVAIVLAVASIVVRGAEILPGGLTQRLSFAVVFGWVLVSGLLAIRSKL